METLYYYPHLRFISFSVEIKPTNQHVIALGQPQEESMY